MRSYEEMMGLIMDKAVNDERIRAVTMDGSRANASATHDEYSDFDICYVVKDVREFTKDKEWITYFGEILIVQCPDDWYSHPYDYTSRDSFTYLIQFEDGNRMDLTIIDKEHIDEVAKNKEPRIVLLNKDDLKEIQPMGTEEIFHIHKPSQMEYDNVCNEFRWLSLYISKGLCRREIYYAKYTYDCLVIPMFMKMLNWKIGTRYDFKVSTGSHSKYLKRYLSEEEMERVHGIFPNGEYEEIWQKLFLMYDYFAENEEEVGKKLGYHYDKDETVRVRAFLVKRKSNK